MKSIQNNLKCYALLNFISKGLLSFVLILLGCCALCPLTFAYPRTPDDLIEISCQGENLPAKRILVAYDTIHGSTAEVSERIGNELCSMGFQVDVRFAGNVTEIEPYAAVIFGSAVYEFNWLPDMLALLKEKHKTLAEKPTACFIVCSAMYEDTPENRAAVKKSFVDPVLAKYPDIKPLSIGLFGGAVDFNTNQYTLFEKVVLRILGKILGFKDSADWRNWEYISQWAKDFGGLIK